MKWVGFFAAIALIIACFLPWVFIESRNITITGMESSGTNFGKPGYFHLFLVAIFIIFNFTPRVWAKRANLLVGALNIAWAARNYFLISACSGGECPEKKPALFIILATSVLILVAVLTPKMTLKEK